MTKKITAVSAAIALGVSGFVGVAPAFAVDNISLKAWKGSTKSNALVGVQDAKNGLVLSTELANFGSATDDNLKYLVEIVTADTAVADLDGGGSSAANDFNVYTQVTSRLSDGRLELRTNGAVAETTTTFTSGGKNYFVIDPVYKGIATVPSTAQEITATTTVVVTLAEGHGFVPGDVVTFDTNTNTADVTSGTVASVTATSVTITTTGKTVAASVTEAGTLKLDAVVDAPKSTLNHLLYINVPAFDGPDADTTNDDTLTLKVTAWIDEVGDNRIGNEYSSSTVEVSFIPEKSFRATGAFDYTFVGQTAVVTGQFSTNVNTENYLTVHNEEETTANALNVDLQGPASNDDATNTVSYDSTKNALLFSAASAGTLAAGAYVATLEAGTSTILHGASSPFLTGNVDAESIAELTLGAVAANSVALKAETSATVMEDTTLVGGANRVVAKTGTTSLKFNVEVKDSSSVFVGAGRVVNVLLEDDSASLGATTITSNGKTLKATGDNSVSFTVTTTSEGIATFTITSDNSAVDGDGEYFNVTVSSEGVSDSLTRVTFQKEAISVVASPESAAKIATGGSIAGTFRVVNQWGQVPTGNYRVHISRTNSSGDRDLTTEQASFVYEVVADSAGRGSFTITDNGDKTVEGTDTVNLKVQKQNTTGGGWADVSGATTSFSLTYEKDLETASLAARANNNGVVLYGTTTKTQPITIEPLSLKAFDGRVDKLSNTKYDVTNTFSTSTLASADGLVAISGEVLTAANAGISNVPVKFSGTGMLFMNQATNTAASSTRFGYQELVVTSGSSGDYTVYVLGNAAGKRTVTISVGSLTKTVDLTFATDGSVADFTVTAASTAEPGRTVDILVAAKDKFGGAAASASVTLSSTGPGYLINTSGTTLSDGTFGTKLLLGSNDTGSAVVKVTMTIDGVSTSKTVTIAVGAAEASAKIGSFNGRVAVRVENAKGSTVSVKIGKSWYKYSAISNNYLQSWKSRKGTSVAVSVYVDGELQNVQTITVK